MFDGAGATRLAIDQTNVYLSRTEEGAKALIDRRGQAFETGDGMAASTPPVNVPGVKCWTKGTPRGVGTRFLVQHGQYVGESAVLDGENKAHQLVAAQYRILTSPK